MTNDMPEPSRVLHRYRDVFTGERAMCRTPSSIKAILKQTRKDHEDFVTLYGYDKISSVIKFLFEKDLLGRNSHGEYGSIDSFEPDEDSEDLTPTDSWEELSRAQRSPSPNPPQLPNSQRIHRTSEQISEEKPGLRSKSPSSVIYNGPIVAPLASHSLPGFEFDTSKSLTRQMSLLHLGERASKDLFEERIRQAPIFSAGAKSLAERMKAVDTKGDLLPGFGLLAGRLEHSFLSPADGSSERGLGPRQRAVRRFSDARIFLNMLRPWSTFICGSQGSGKSHTMTCMLESCLVPDPKIGQLSYPLAGLAFTYDGFIPTLQNPPCEAARLASSGATVEVRVFPANLRQMREAYRNFDDRIDVQPCLFDEDWITFEDMRDILTADGCEGIQPFQVDIALQMARRMSIDPGAEVNCFKFRAFSTHLRDIIQRQEQLQPLETRLDMLEEFLADRSADGRSGILQGGLDWSPQPGVLQIVDLSSECLGVDTACGIFNMCLRIATSARSNIGRVIALDDADQYIGHSHAAAKLMDSLALLLRRQRHTGLRVILAAQEPSVSTKFLDLCSFTLIHSLSCPSWLNILKEHVGAIAKECRDGRADVVLDQVAGLEIGEAIMCAPNGLLDSGEPGMAKEIIRLGSRGIKIKVRTLLSADGSRPNRQAR